MAGVQQNTHDVKTEVGTAGEGRHQEGSGEGSSWGGS